MDFREVRAVELFKLRIQNLGRIANAELSIRPLTIFVGPNNTNKTWTAYALYGLAQLMAEGNARFTRDVASAIDLIQLDRQTQAAIESAVSKFSALLDGADETTDVVNNIVRSEICGNFSYPVNFHVASAGLSKILSVHERELADAVVGVEVGESQFLGSSLNNATLTYRKGHPQSFEANIPAGRAWKTVIEGSIDGASFVRRYLRPPIRSLVFGLLQDVIAIPAERKGLVAVQGLLPSIPPDTLSMPVRNFVQLLSDIQYLTVSENDIDPFRDLVSLLEERVLDGNVGLEGETGDKKLTFSYRAQSRLGLNAASSLVRSLAWFDLYLGEYALDKDLVVIDEPEMNAHPEAQLMIAELLCILANRGVNVVVTTHSPYIVDHVNNLAEAAELPESRQEGIAARFKLQTKEAFIPTDKVATYLFNEDGRVEDIFDRKDRIIDWGTFGKTSDRVTNLYGEILDLAGQK